MMCCEMTYRYYKDNPINNLKHCSTLQGETKGGWVLYLSATLVSLFAFSGRLCHMCSGRNTTLQYAFSDTGYNVVLQLPVPADLEVWKIISCQPT